MMIFYFSSALMVGVIPNVSRKMCCYVGYLQTPTMMCEVGDDPATLKNFIAGRNENYCLYQSYFTNEEYIA
jgi:hypothetical protein